MAFLALKRRWYIKGLRYSSPILAFIAPVILMVGHHKALAIPLVVVLVSAAFWLIGWAIFVFLTLIIATIRRNFEAGLLLIPLVLTMVGIAEPILTGGMGDFGGGTYKSPLTIQAGPIPIHFAAIADFTGLLAIIVIIFVRFLRIHHEQERASGELAAARSVQELMIPREKVETPGYEVDSVYNPANEVGGDFFHVEPTSGRRTAGHPRRCGGQRPAGRNECFHADGRAAPTLKEKPGANSRIAESRADRKRQLYDLPGGVVRPRRRGRGGQCRASAALSQHAGSPAAGWTAAWAWSPM